MSDNGKLGTCPTCNAPCNAPCNVREAGAIENFGDTRHHVYTFSGHENWTDDNGTVWRPPTAWAYAQSCRVREELRTKLALAEQDSKRLDWFAEKIALITPLMGYWYVSTDAMTVERFDNVRDAIDAAIAAGEGRND